MGTGYADPNQLVAILHRAPYHPDTLLQLSEVAAHNEDQGQATRFLNQALFVNEKTLWTAASSFFSAGHCRLDFKIVENRNLFKALDLKSKLLLKQGCYRSSFQTCKFLFSLNPYQDPFGSLLWFVFSTVFFLFFSAFSSSLLVCHFSSFLRIYHNSMGCATIFFILCILGLAKIQFFSILFFLICLLRVQFELTLIDPVFVR
jgi:hypothetical protein